MSRNLDFLRAIAVLSVLIGHLFVYNFHQTIPGASAVAHKAAHVGVILFFVHTSYVLMLSLERQFNQHKGFLRTSVSFYVRRILRIYPLAMFSICIVTLLGAPYVLPMASEQSGSFIANLFLVQNLVHKPQTFSGLWTLPVELQMYIFLPLCFLLARKSMRLALLLGIVSLSLGIAVLGSYNQAYLVAVYAPCFISGVISYALVTHYPAIKKISGSYWAPALLLVIIGLSAIFWPEGGVSDWATALGVALLIPIFKDMSLSYLSKASFWVATYSYGIYLFHIPIMTFTQNAWVSTIVLTVIGAVLAYHLIESPAIKFGQRITGGTLRKQALVNPAP